MNPVTLAQLSINPLQSGCWWVTAPHGDMIAEWVDVLAEEAKAHWPGRVAVLDGAATLISNLRVWENLILPVWWRDNLPIAALEESVAAAFDLAQVAQKQREKLAVCLPAALDRADRRFVMLLRSVLIEPECVIIEEDCWHDLVARSQESPHAKLFSRLKAVTCLIVVGSMPALAGFFQTDIVERVE
ncbi:MAG: hypothetical protein P4L87_14420 [Formivibrio sp.]|nr:hypothetical protein [Formivibrio sp.]